MEHEGDDRAKNVPSSRSPWRPYAPFLIFCAVGIVPSMLFVDRPLTEYVGTHRDGMLHYFADNVDWAGRAEFYLVPAALVYGIGLVWPVVDRRGAAFVFLNVAATGIVVNILKVLFGRARPRLLFNEGIFGFGFWEFENSWRSFPSGHTTTAFAGMVALGMLVPRYRWIFWAFAAFMGACRILSLDHYLSDVFAGAILGVSGAIMLRGYLIDDSRRLAANGRD